MANPTSVVLASSSPFRRILLERLSIPFECANPAIDETPIPNETPENLVCRLAEAKAQALQSQFPSHLIIGSDQVAVHNEQILGKPHTIERAVAQLKQFQGQRVAFYTGLSVFNSKSGKSTTLMEPFYVQFKCLSTADIQRYVELEMPLNCAGSFKSEGLGICLFESMQGDDPTTLVGLPLIQLCNLLTKHGYNVLHHAQR